MLFLTDRVLVGVLLVVPEVGVADLRGDEGVVLVSDKRPTLPDGGFFVAADIVNAGVMAVCECLVDIG